jgi:hypothetical protein
VFLDPSGGIRYHARAWLQTLSVGNHSWTEHQIQISRWVEWILKQAPEASELLLIGPNAGYNLPWPLFKNRFESIVAIDPDPIAQWGLKTLRSRQIGQKIFCIDSLPLHSFYPIRWKKSLVLFCNVLGQLSDSMTTASENQQKQTLAHFEWISQNAYFWASFHDRWGFSETPPTQTEPTIRSETRLTPESYQKLALASCDTPEVWWDHDADAWFPPLKTSSEFFYWQWKLRPSQIQVIEACQKPLISTKSLSTS